MNRPAGQSITGSVELYGIQWPILDEHKTRTELIALAGGELPEILARAGRERCSDIVWSVRGPEDNADEGYSFLTALMDTRRVEVTV